MRHRISIEIHDTIFIENWKPFYILHIIFPYTPDMISLPSFVGGTKATEWLGVMSFICLVCVHQWKKCLVHLFQGKEGARVECQIGRKLPTQALKMKIWSDALVT